MASVLQVNNNYILSTSPYYMGEGGTYIPKPPAVVRQNGLGWDVVAGYASVEWSWEWLTVADITWWYTIMLGQPSFQFSQAKLYNHIGVLTTYTNCVVHMPTFEKIVGDTYFNVKLVIDQLI